MLSNHWIKAWSKSQRLIVLSHAESELHASVKASAEAFGIESIAEDLNMMIDVKCLGDVSAALGITSRRGIRNVCYLDANNPCTKEMAAKKKLEYSKVIRSQNPADQMTKELFFRDTEKYSQIMSSASAEGRREMASNMAIHEGTVAEQDDDKITVCVASGCGGEWIELFQLKRQDGKLTMIV